MPPSPQPTSPQTSPTPTSEDPDFLRHRQALATHLTTTRPETLQSTLTTGAATISHW